MKSSALSAMGRRTAEPPISWLMQTTLSRPNLISLAAGFTDNESLPVLETRALLEAVLRSPKARQALQYGSTPGDETLRELTVEHLQRADGMATPGKIYSPGRVLVTGGSQQLLYMVTEALCDPGDIVLVEDPTYFVYLSILQSRGIRARAARLGREGLDPGHLKEVLQALERRGELPRVKLLYSVSYFQNPTGVTTSLERKHQTLKLLKEFGKFARHPIYLLEDAAYRELRFAGKDVPSALALRNFSDRVIYAGTYSKPFATGARVGFGVLPEPVFTAVLRIKGNHDFGTSNLLQQLMSRALASGLYVKHVRRLRRRYAQKARVMKEALEKHFPAGVEWWEPQGGLYFWARLPRRLKAGLKSKVFQAALNHNVLYVPGEFCYADDPARPKPNHELRLSFGNARERDIREGIARLGAVLHELLDR